MTKKPIRRYERFSVDFMDVHGKILFKSDIKILNISVGGVSFHTDKHLKIGGKYLLRLESKGTTLHLRVTVIWTKLNEHTKGKKNIIQTYTVGMKFSHSSVTRDKEIKQFIQNNLKKHQKIKTVSTVIKNTRIHVRFLINEPDKAMIHCDEHCKIKKISLGGMLIESDNIMPIGETLPMEMTIAKNKPINLWGKFVTCQAIQGKEPPRYEIGIEFIDISEKDKKLLKSFIVSLKK